MYAQTNDKNLEVAMAEVDTISMVENSERFMQKGGFEILSEDTPYDTIVIPKTGVYRLDINIKYVFEPKKCIPINTPFEVSVTPIMEGKYLPSLATASGLCSKQTTKGILSTSMMVKVDKDNAKLKLLLDAFTFGVAELDRVMFTDISVGLQMVDPIGLL